MHYAFDSDHNNPKKKQNCELRIANKSNTNTWKLNATSRVILYFERPANVTMYWFVLAPKFIDSQTCLAYRRFDSKTLVLVELRMKREIWNKKNIYIYRECLRTQKYEKRYEKRWIKEDRSDWSHRTGILCKLKANNFSNLFAHYISHNNIHILASLTRK